MTDIHRRVAGGTEAALLLADGQGRVLYNNASAIRMLGRDLSGASLISDPFEDDLPLVEAVAGRYRQTAEKGAAVHELIVHTEQSGPRYVWLSIAPPGPEEPARGDRVVMLLDVGEALTGSPAVRKVFSQVNHDLRSPLTSIGGAVELLQSGRVGTLEGMQKRLVAIVEESARRMQEILAAAKGRLSQETVTAGGEGRELRNDPDR
ncbi:MAG TPA: histidine kinase dimerization/phospho-acceptor domain-containing protein [Candidatus Polarisedimenticolia bacterium]|nr:histidine kinase dimerization/phospho-acceptor domain-containing protein [Candidatus Polarisedimenticolia bacterium]